MYEKHEDEPEEFKANLFEAVCGVYTLNHDNMRL